MKLTKKYNFVLAPLLPVALAASCRTESIFKDNHPKIIEVSSRTPEFFAFENEKPHREGGPGMFELSDGEVYSPGKPWYV